MGLTAGNAHREFTKTNFPSFTVAEYQKVMQAYKHKQMTSWINNGA